MHRHILLIIGLLWASPLFSQSPDYFPGCASDPYRAYYGASPKGATRAAASEMLIRQRISEMPQERPGGYVIPVVFHIVHNNGASNIPDAQISYAVDLLNNAFANVSPYDPVTGASAPISFCLAEQDSTGAPSTGIERVVSTLTDMTMETQDLQVKALSYYPSADYLNIWVVNSITSLSVGSGVAGYANFPSEHGLTSDGIMMEAQYTGGSTYDNVVLIHEVGHYLGLYHTFEGGCGNNDCSLDGDRVCDTPPDATSAPVNCVGQINTCTTDDDDLSAQNPFRPVANGGLGDQFDLGWAYMDYNILSCQTGFSAGQVNRMVAALTGPRASLLQSIGCVAHCATPVVAGFTGPTGPILIGTTVNFTNTTTNANTYDWKLDGTSFSTLTNPSYTFNTTGSFEVRLTASGPGVGCVDSSSQTVVVECTSQSSFVGDTNVIAAGGSVNYTNTSTGGGSYTWLVDGMAVSNSTNYTASFNQIGGHHICLVVDNGTCADTSCVYLPVGTCPDKRGNVWAFGLDYNGLDFNNTPPTWRASALGTDREGSASICDEAGNLLLYTNGKQVYNGQDQLLANGSGLWGGQYSTSSDAVLILPLPESDSLYYIFTVDEMVGWHNTYGGLSYSIADVTAGVNGTIIQKNEPLLTPTAEKIMATRHSNGCDWWIIVHEFWSNRYMSFRLTPQGVDPVPVISSVGFPHTHGQMTSFPYVNTLNAQGQSEISVDGNRIAVVIMDTMKIEVLDFDKSTGQVSNPLTLDMPGDYQYGVALSPDGNRLYAANIYNNLQSDLVQFDLAAGSQAQVQASLTVLNSVGTNYSYQGMALGPDGKIYCGRYQELAVDVIANPNGLGAACNLQVGAVPINSSISMGMPTTVPNLALAPEASIQGPTVLCPEAEAHYYFPKSSCVDLAEWSVDGVAYILSDNDSTVVLGFTGMGNATLYGHFTGICSESYDTLHISVQGQVNSNLGPDLAFCGLSSLTLDAGSTGYQYLWDDGSGNPTRVVTAPGTYWVTTSLGGYCPHTDTIVVADSGSYPVQLDLGPDLSDCKGGINLLNAGSGFASYEWQDGSADSTFTAWQPGTYWCDVVDLCGVSHSDTVQILQLPAPTPDLGPDTVLCEGGLILKTLQSYASYQWSDGSTNPSVLVTQPGTYWVQVWDGNGCHGTDTIFVDDCVALDAGQDPLSMGLRPNPAQGEAFLDIEWQGAPQTAELRIYNYAGQVIRSREIELVAGRQARRLDLAGLSAGAYWVTLRVDAGTWHRRLMVQ